MCIWALIPKEGPTGEKIPAINLGLDLQGGMHLAVEIDDPDGTLSDEARADAIERTLTTDPEPDRRIRGPGTVDPEGRG